MKFVPIKLLIKIHNHKIKKHEKCIAHRQAKIMVHKKAIRALEKKWFYEFYKG
jgi:hypothetical protein